MKPTFDHTVSILVQAYLNDELAHKTCSACAVGNIVAAAIGTKPKRNSEYDTVEFDNHFFDNGAPAHGAWYDTITGHKTTITGLQQVAATGYSIEELYKIERAFENAPGDKYDNTIGFCRGRCTEPEWMFNGLIAVVDVLAEIHGVNLEVKENAKLQFIKV